MTKPRILVVEDEAGFRIAVVEALVASGYSALGMADAAQALERLPETAPALIILDMMMPGIDGFEFLTRLRKDPRWGSIPVLILSALGDHMSRSIDTKGAQSLGVAGFLAKPVSLDTLLDEVRRIVTPGTAA